MTPAWSKGIAQRKDGGGQERNTSSLGNALGFAAALLLVVIPVRMLTFL